jgi:hypothetical protein
MSKKVVAIIGILLLVVILFDPFSFTGNVMEQRKSLNDLANAKTLWETKGITSYKIKVRGAVPLGCIYDAILTFHNDELVDVQAKKSFDKNSEYVTVNKQRWSESPCNYAQISISQVFSDANDILKNIDLVNQRLKITFDPTYGFITRYQFSYNSYGLLTARLVWDCCAWYEFSDFHPIE